MKKYILSICLLVLSCCLLFGASSSIGVSVTGTTGSSVSYDIGFSKISIPQWTVYPVHFENDSISLIPAFNEDGQIIGVSEENTLFLYWRLVADVDVTISIALSGTMRNGDSELGWTVSWPPYGNNEKLQAKEKVLKPDEILPPVKDPIDYNSLSFKVIKQLPKLITVSSVAGSIPLRIETNVLKGKNADIGTSYKGSICLRINVQ